MLTRKSNTFPPFIWNVCPVKYNGYCTFWNKKAFILYFPITLFKHWTWQNKWGKILLQEIPAFCDFRICDPLYFMILFEASISWFWIIEKQKKMLENHLGHFSEFFCCNIFLFAVETIQGRKLYDEILYLRFSILHCKWLQTNDR